MLDRKTQVDTKKVDTKEFHLPETFFIRDIENRVFQGIVLQCLSQIEGIGLIEGNFIDSIFSRGQEGIGGIHVDQESKNQSVTVKIEINIQYGYSIPEKAEEIQTHVANEITKITGLHVSCVHVVFKNVLPLDQIKMLSPIAVASLAAAPRISKESEDDYNDEF
ncbi:MAG TPA: Asp23/Gls24 family envelope stress response protein [Parachlamydiaceae bacterium]|nr:Asp23/Gls24 family envelope stress response protein [Parachlamydiaceae bacterium]